MSYKQGLVSLIHDSIKDFNNNADSKSPSEWLQGYLGEKLPSHSVEAIHNISGEILDTLDLMEQKKAAISAASQKGTSAENWLTDDIMAESGGNGEKARAAAAFFNGIVSGQRQYSDTVEAEAVVIDESSAEWQDSSWNDYKLKGSLKALAVDVGRAGLKEIASDICVKASEEGIGAALADCDLMTDALTNGAAAGLKVAVSAGLTVASSKGIIPESSVSVLTATAFKAVESAKAIGDVIKGRCSMTEALVNIKNSAVATFSGMWKQHKSKILTEAADMAGTVFGPVGAAAAGAVCGLFAKKSGESRVKTVLKEAGKAVARFLTKKIHLPFLSKAKVLQVNA